MNRRHRLRLPILLALTCIVMAAAGCSFQLSQVAIENQTSQVIRVADSQLSCNDEPDLSDLPSHTLQPGERRSILTFTSKSVFDDCIFVAGRGGKASGAPIEAKALYAVTESGGALRIARSGDNDKGFDFTGKAPPLWLALVLGVPFAVGALVALWITVRFFYRYYVQGRG